MAQVIDLAQYWQGKIGGSTRTFACVNLGSKYALFRMADPIATAIAKDLTLHAVNGSKRS